MRARLERACRAFLRGEAGAVTVEFVVIFPLIVLLVFLIVFVSLLIATASDVQQAAHELSRQAMSRLARTTTVPDVCTQMKNDTALMGWISSQSVTLNPAKFQVLPCPNMPAANGNITVTVRYNFAGSFVQSVGQNLGVNLGVIERSSISRL